MLALETAHPHARDESVAFDEASHTYTITRGGVAEVAPCSVSGFAKRYFSEFDPDAVAAKYYQKWAADPNSKYHALIHSVLGDGGSEAEARAAIKAGWKEKGRQASEKGTRMHEHCELEMNGVPPVLECAEMRLFRKWRAEFQPHMRWEPVRTEWRLWYEDERCGGRVLVAGTLDLLMRSETTDEYSLWDYKRVDPAPKYRGGPPRLLGPHGSAKFHPGFAAEPLEVEDSDFGKYTMQLNIYAKMLRDRYGIDVGKHMYLVQLHEAMDTFHAVRVDQHASSTDALFAAEAARAA
jgi:hypothetical protein